MKKVLLLSVWVCAWPASASAQAIQALGLFEQRCGSCHTKPAADSRAPDRDSLRQIADTTHGRFSSAASISDLKRIYSDLGSAIAHVTRQREITTWFVGVGLAFALAAAGASLVWTSRLP